MASTFTATINSITAQDDGSGTDAVNFVVAVTFADSASGFATTKTYAFPANTTQQAAVATITADGQAYKSNIASLSNLQSKVGTVLTI